MRHILFMTGAASIGTMAMFAVDLADLLFLSWLEDVAITDAISYAGPILIFTASVSIGLMIAMGALVARALGARRNERAKRQATNVFVYSFVLVAVVATVVWLYIPELLSLMGAEGRAHELGQQYLRIVIASMPLASMSMCAGGLLRAYGDYKMTMAVTLLAAVVNGILDPILIFGFDMGIEGAAYATVIARLFMLFFAFYVALAKHDAVAPFKLRGFQVHSVAISAIAVPAILTNVATPLGFAFVTRIMSDFGDGAVTGLNITVRLSHVIFAVMFSLSGAIGPIVGQNLGAGLFARVRRSLLDSLGFMIIYVLIATLALYLLQDAIIAAFRADGVSAELILLFCNGLAATFLFSGCIFVANAGFNNLGRPHYSTMFNFGRATLGTLPFAWYGAKIWGASGVLVGQAAGGVLFGIIAYTAVMWHVRRITDGRVTLGMVRKARKT